MIPLLLYLGDTFRARHCSSRPTHPLRTGPAEVVSRSSQSLLSGELLAHTPQLARYTSVQHTAALPPGGAGWAWPEVHSPLVAPPCANQGRRRPTLINFPLLAVGDNTVSDLKQKMKRKLICVFGAATPPTVHSVLIRWRFFP